MPDVEYRTDDGHVRPDNPGQHAYDPGTTHLETADQQASDRGPVPLTAELLTTGADNEATMRGVLEATPAAPSARRRKRFMLVAGCLLLVLLAVAAAAVALWPRTDSEYLKALQTAG